MEQVDLIIKSRDIDSKIEKLKDIIADYEKQKEELLINCKHQWANGESAIHDYDYDDMIKCLICNKKV